MWIIRSMRVPRVAAWVLALTLVCAGLTHSPAVSSGAVHPGAPYAVGKLAIVVREPSSGATAERSFTAIVRYPALGRAGNVAAGLPPMRGANKFPLLVFSQGYDMSPEAYAGLLDAWASAGYVVADPFYLFTTPGQPGGVNRADIVRHPTDLRFTISRLIALADQPHGVLSGLVNADEIGIVGQSDGGDVSLAVAASSCCRDVRVSAAVILSGAELAWFPGSYFTTRALFTSPFPSTSPPLLVVQGTDDYVNPPSCSTALYNRAPEPKYYLSLQGQDHLSAYLPPGAARNVVASTTIVFFDAYLRHSRHALSALRRVGNRPGLASITGAERVAPAVGGCPDAPVQ